MAWKLLGPEYVDGLGSSTMTAKEQPPEPVRFHGELLKSGGTTTGFHVPDEVVAALGTSRKPPVKVTINGYTWRSSIAFMGGKFMLGVSAEQRKNAGVAGGDLLDVEVLLDTEPRKIEVPADFATALAASPKAQRFFDSLSFSNQRRHVDAINAAKTDQTRQRRIATSVQTLTDGEK